MSNLSSSDIQPLQALSEELCTRSTDLIFRSEQVQGQVLTAIECEAIRTGHKVLFQRAEELRQMAAVLRKIGG